ncbi:MAG: hypothetical protein GY929_02200 [Actinomycetia bacterium]|nr:hypothetical protein [Actinomycetes bacterium]
MTTTTADPVAGAPPVVDGPIISADSHITEPGGCRVAAAPLDLGVVLSFPILTGPSYRSRGPKPNTAALDPAAGARILGGSSIGLYALEDISAA